MNRELDWEGLPNARTLGGLPVITPDGTTTVHGRVYRSATLSHLTDAGWAALGAAGVRTIIDLRNRDEGPRYVAPDGVVVHHAPIEDQTDRAFMAQFGVHLSTPRYYPEVLTRWPYLVVRAFRCIAAAQPGGVVVHCMSGQDRTGQVIAMLLSLVGVPVDAIADDYEVAMRASNAFALVSPMAEHPGVDDATMGVMVGEARAMLTFWLSSLNVADYLLSAGMATQEVSRLRSRLLVP